jgi:Suppressor of fused protein (SUFU)
MMTGSSILTNFDSRSERFQRHVAAYIGEIDMCLEMPEVHSQVLVVGPNPEVGRNFYTCVTAGISDTPMKAPKGEEKHIELLLCLPGSWQMSQEDFTENLDNFWPIALLMQLSEYVVNENTWLGLDHTIPNGEALGSNTKMSGVLIGVPFAFDKNLLKLRINFTKTVCFLQIFPMYEKEIAYSMNNGVERLWDKFFDKYDDLDILNDVLVNHRRACVV